MKDKKHLNRWLIISLITLTATLDASISGVARDISMKGTNVATILQDTKGGIFIQTSTDGGDTWSSPPVQLQGASSLYQNILPSITVAGPSGSKLACCFSSSVSQGYFYLRTTSSPDNPEFVDFLSNANGSPLGLESVQDEVFVVDSTNYSVSPTQGISLDILAPPYQNFLQSDHNSPNNLITSGSPLPSLIAASTTTTPPSALCVTWQRKTPSSILFQQYSAGALWEPTAQHSVIPGFEQLNASSVMQLVALEDLSLAALVSLNNGQLSTNLCIDPMQVQWTNPIPLTSDPLSLVGGINLDPNPSTYALQTLCSTVKGKLVHVVGSLETGLTLEIPQPAFFDHVRQISSSASKHVFGWWLVLHESTTGNQLLLLRGNASSHELNGFIVVDNLTAVTDHNIAMAVTVDEDTGAVVAVFDISSPNPHFDPHFPPVFPSGSSGPGTYVCTVEAPGGLSTAKIRKIN